jgi:hypothetical protein
MCTSLCLLSAVLLGVLYLFFGVRPSDPSTRLFINTLTSFQAFPLVFGNNHGFNLWQTGLTFLGLFVGNVIGVSCDPFWRRNCKCHPQREIQKRTVELGLERLTQENLDDRLVRNNGGISEPEFRLAPTIAYVSQQSQHSLRALSSGLDARCAAVAQRVRKEPQMRSKRRRSRHAAVVAA